MIGALAGGFAWIALLGMAIGAHELTFGAPAAALLGYKLLQRPGTIVMFIAACNVLVMNVYWERIPEEAWGITTSKATLGLWPLNVCLAALALLGLWFNRRRADS